MAGQSWVKFQRNKLSSETVIKKTRLQFCISSLHMNRKLVSHGTFEVLFISEPKRKIVALLFLLTLLKFQTPLTLSSHNSGSKNYSNKNHHIFRKPWTSAFRWHIRDTSWKICIGVIGRNVKRTRFCPFSVSAPNNVGGRRSDNFEGTGRALPIAHF